MKACAGRHRDRLWRKDGFCAPAASAALADGSLNFGLAGAALDDALAVDEAELAGAGAPLSSLRFFGSRESSVSSSLLTAAVAGFALLLALDDALSFELDADAADDCTVSSSSSDPES